MADDELHSYIFDFTRVNDFFENFNVKFNVNDSDNGSKLYILEDDEYINTGDKFELVFASACPDNISDGCLTNTGQIDRDNVEYDDNHVVEVELDWIKDSYGDAIIHIHDEVTLTLGETVLPLKAVFLRSKSNGYVLGYCINLVKFSVTNKVVFDDDVMFWDITRYKV